ncbi:DoxX family protein [Sphingosinithalassobacter portus]|uniref:DoxX family protein n=1 Tax=Stakelama portus TaxID=2676234 RepID=UPI000D6E5984|nr:DoxX family protein [Sphingosinithalassobacter portus]
MLAPSDTPAGVSTAARININTNTKHSDYAALIGRIAIAAIFLLSGFSKLTAPGATIGYIASAGLPLPQVALALAILVELGGGMLLVFGYRVRIVAAALAIFSVVAALGFHSDLADQNQFIHFFKNLAMAGGLLQIVAFGGGRLSIDRR